MKTFTNCSSDATSCFLQINKLRAFRDRIIQADQSGHARNFSIANFASDRVKNRN